MLVFLLHLAVTHEEVGIDAGWILTGLALGIEGHRELLLLFRLQVGQEAEFIETVVLIEVVELHRNSRSDRGRRAGRGSLRHRL